jgi:hypothetical protein
LYKVLIKKLHASLSPKTDKRLLILVSDDWGAIRLNSLNDRNALEQRGFKMRGNRFDSFDCLETTEDIESIYQVLLKYKDHKGNPPIITAATLVANPDLDKIEKSHFEEYHFETIETTYARHSASSKVIETMQAGIHNKIFMPECHGREHLQITWWTKLLEQGEPGTIEAFKYGFFMLSGEWLPFKNANGLGAAFDFHQRKELDGQVQILEQGLQFFKDIFGYDSCYFTPPATILHPSLEKYLPSHHVTWLDVPIWRKFPVGNGKYRHKIHYLGQKSKSGLRYLIRNAVFEPNMNKDDDGVETCLQQVATAFRHRLPAIVSNHRAAFVGGIDPANRVKGCQALDRLLKLLLKNWPDIEFITVRDLNLYYN